MEILSNQSGNNVFPLFFPHFLQTRNKMDDLEGLVRRIVNTVNTTRTRPAEPNADTTSGALAQQPGTTVEEEVRRRYSLPRNATTSVYTSGSTEQSAESTQPFSLPVETRVQRSNVGPLSQYFRPTENYGQCTLRTQSRNRQVRQRRRASPYGRTNVQPCKDKVKADSFTLKEVVLLPSPSYSNVPKFSSKVELNNKGLIVDGFHVNKNWSEQELREKLQATFENKLRDRQGEIIR